MVVAESRQGRIDEALGFLNIVCGALVVGVAAFAMVAWFISSGGPGEQTSLGPPLPRAVAFFGLFVGIALLLAAPVIHKKTLERVVAHQRPDERVTTVLESFRLATLISFILREGAAIVGLMLTLLTNEPMWCYVLCAAAVVGMIWGWPRAEQLSGLLGAEA